MATLTPLRRVRRRRGGVLKLRLLAGVAAPLGVMLLAPVALARPSTPAPAAALLPSALPSVCVGGVVLCGGHVVDQPTPCVAGQLQCSPLPVPSACVGGIGCTGEVVGPGQSPTSTPGAPRQSAGNGQAPAPNPGGTGGGISTGAALVLPAPPGVGLIAPVRGSSADGGPGPDAFSTVLALSLRDGLFGGRYHVWPWLLAVQLLLWALIAAYLWLRPPTSAPRPATGS